MIVALAIVGTFLCTFVGTFWVAKQIFAQPPIIQIAPIQMQTVVTNAVWPTEEYSKPIPVDEFICNFCGKDLGKVEDYEALDKDLKNWWVLRNGNREKIFGCSRLHVEQYFMEGKPND